eukprot:TRINITY_DN124951_c0_g1_i1.p1 TRINITY_DN124951_c0_g1~~TRINITY_DN124951_c0_g1_i1.p1  ORF type:complete len:259 (+),score=1.24 TRINITY_DN124951_c0_g1_i1:48-779(+)
MTSIYEGRSRGRGAHRTSCSKACRMAVLSLFAFALGMVFAVRSLTSGRFDRAQAQSCAFSSPLGRRLVGMQVLTAALSAASGVQSAAAEPKIDPRLDPTKSWLPLGERGLGYRDLRVGTGQQARDGAVVQVQWSGRLFSKQGLAYGRCGDPECELRFRVGDGTTIPGLDEGIRGMKQGGIRRLLIPPPLAYREDKDLQPLPESEDGRRILYSTVFNPTRIANGEGDTLGTIVLDVSLTRLRAD